MSAAPAISPASLALIEALNERGWDNQFVAALMRVGYRHRTEPLTPATALPVYLDAAMGSTCIPSSAYFAEPERLPHLADSLAHVAEGRTPVLFLSAGQQEALEYSDPPDREMAMSTPNAFENGAFVVLARPFQLGTTGAALYAVDFSVDMLSALMVFGYLPEPGDDGTLHVVAGVALDNDQFEDEDPRDDLRATFRALLSIGYASRMFGLTETPPAMTRAQHRQAARDARRDDPQLKAKIAVRYLRDPHATIKTTFVTATGNHVRPHWRRGHYRRVWMGSTATNDRRTEVRFISPVLVNSHLGRPAPSVYAWGPLPKGQQ